MEEDELPTKIQIKVEEETDVIPPPDECECQLVRERAAIKLLDEQLEAIFARIEAGGGDPLSQGTETWKMEEDEWRTPGAKHA